MKTSAFEARIRFPVTDYRSGHGAGWYQCENCGIARWFSMKPQGELCKECGGEHWKPQFEV